MIKNTGGQKVGAQMLLASDSSAFTDIVTCYLCGDSEVQVLGTVNTGVCINEGNGFYTYTPSQAETNFDYIAFTFIGTNAIPVTTQIYTAIIKQSGDCYALIGANGSGLTSLATQASVSAVAADIAALPTANDNATTVWNKLIETGYTATQIMKLFASVLLGKVSGAGTGVEVFRDINDTRPRVTAIISAEGNRNTITLDPD